MPRPRSTAAALAVRGSRLAKERTVEELAAPPGRPAPPPHLSDLAREEWERIVVDLEALGTLSTLDRAALEGYVGAYELHRLALADVAAHGPTQEVTTKHGDVMRRANPSATLAKSALGELRGYLREFGLTTASRSKVAAAREAIEAAKPKKPTALEELLAE